MLSREMNIKSTLSCGKLDDEGNLLRLEQRWRPFWTRLEKIAQEAVVHFALHLIVCEGHLVNPRHKSLIIVAHTLGRKAVGLRKGV